MHELRRGAERAIIHCISFNAPSTFIACRSVVDPSFNPHPTLASNTSRVVGVVAKGAGMVEPDMATMLVFIMTDATLPGGGEAMQAR